VFYVDTWFTDKEIPVRMIAILFAADQAHAPDLSVPFDMDHLFKV